MALNADITLTFSPGGASSAIRPRYLSFNPELRRASSLRCPRKRLRCPPMEISQSLRKSRAQRGFTLIETMVSILVLTIGLVGTAALMSQSVNMGAHARFVSTAALLASEKMEDLRPLSDDDPNLNAGGSLGADVAGYSDSVQISSNNGNINETTISAARRRSTPRNPMACSRDSGSRTPRRHTRPAHFRPPLADHRQPDGRRPGDYRRHPNHGSRNAYEPKLSIPRSRSRPAWCTHENSRTFW